MISWLKVIRKILRYLPNRWKPKVTTINKSTNVDLMRVNELIGSLQTNEMTLPSKKRPKWVTLKASSKYKNKFNDESELIIT